MYEHILVPTDGSEGTMQAIKHVLEFAGDELTVHVLSVVDQRVHLAASDDQQDAVTQLLRGDAIDAAERCTEKCEGRASTMTMIRDSAPHRVILDYAGEHGADVVVMGTHGQTGRDKPMSPGSVIECIIENVKRPVLVVHID